MKKIPTLYQRDPATNLKHVLNEPHPDCLWVLAGEGTPTYKWDGTAVLIDDHYQPWKRREVKAGKPIPDGFREETHDLTTNKRTGWIPLDPDDKSNRWHFEALTGHLTPAGSVELAPGTYELIGPKVQGNPHGFRDHMLMPHGAGPDLSPPTSFDELGQWLHAVDTNMAPAGFEGIVWHHPDGRMAKIKVRDFPNAT